KARSELPFLILGPHEILAARYASVGSYQDCKRHLDLIAQSGFPDEVVRVSTWNAVKEVAGAKLEDLCRRAKQEFDEVKERASKATFDRMVGPMLHEAGNVRELLMDRLQLAESVLEESAFDRLALTIKESVDKKINYEGEDRERSILYSSKVFKRLLDFPLSSQVRHQIQQAIQEDNRYLYSLFNIAPGSLPQALECFFLSGAEADPEA